MNIAWLALIVITVAAIPQGRGARDFDLAQRQPAPVAASQTQDSRADRMAALRERAKARLDAERQRFGVAELADIEARYSSAFRPEVMDGRTFLRLPEAEPILQELVRRYPQSNRAGCALVLLAQQSTGAQREAFLRQAIEHDRDAWFETGVQVGAIARAMLAIHLAGLDRFDEAETVAAELVERYPGAIDQTGATLDETLIAIRQLRRLHSPVTAPRQPV
jgi:hypothetical protein